MINCKKCNFEFKYNYKHDATYCEKCDEWLEKTCSDVHCKYCLERPAKPSEAKND